MHSAQTNLQSYHFTKLTTSDIPMLSNFTALLPGFVYYEEAAGGHGHDKQSSPYKGSL